MRRIRSAGLVACLLALALPASAQEARLGSVSMPNSGSDAAQQPFLRGLALLHSFEYGPAREAFREAQEADPGFALAFWGEAMAYNYPLWYRQFTDEARAALDRLASTPAERRATAPTERERRWLDAVETLYGEGSKQERDDRYERAMAEFHRDFPDDPEVAVFHALAILGTAHEGRAHGTYMRAGAIASALQATYPDHPGAAHYTIHAFDDPVHAALGLRAARAYSDIAPDAAHAQHMTSHIFLALGMWDDVVRANERADEVSDRAGGRSCGHYNEWLEYGYLMQGRTDAALDLLQACGARAAAGEESRRSFADMRTRYVLDAEEWQGPAFEIAVDLSGDPRPALTDAFLRGFAAARSGHVAGARAALADLERLRPEVERELEESGFTEAMYVRRPMILEVQLVGMVRWAEGDLDGAVDAFEEAARLEADLPHAFGPPVIEKPSFELLGEALLARGSVEQAADAFAEAAERAPGRVPALAGLREAAERAGDPDLAEWAAGRLPGL